MIRFRDEGEEAEVGLNFYPPKSKSSIGFMLVPPGMKWAFLVRYSKITGRFYTKVLP